MGCAGHGRCGVWAVARPSAPARAGLATGQHSREPPYAFWRAVGVRGGGVCGGFPGQPARPHRWEEDAGSRRSAGTPSRRILFRGDAHNYPNSLCARTTWERQAILYPKRWRDARSISRFYDQGKFDWRWSGIREWIHAFYGESSAGVLPSVTPVLVWPKVLRGALIIVSATQRRRTKK